MSQYQAEIDAFMDGVRAKQAHESEFLQAVEEVQKRLFRLLLINRNTKRRKF